MEDIKFEDIPLDELHHHGIKNMKWGIRRFQNKDGSLTAAGRARQRLREASDRRKAKKQAEIDAKERKRRDREEFLDRHKPVRVLSEDELKKRIDRLTLEKQYKTLVKDVETVSRGKKILDKIIETASENIGTQLATYALGSGVNKIAKEVFKTSGDIVNPKKGQKDK